MTHRNDRYEEASSIHVCHTSGDDSNDGSLDHPVKSIQLAADLAASATEKTAVVLRDGTHYIADTITLTSKHSNLNFMSFPGESATVSGGTALKTTWKKATGMANASMNVYVADISGQVADVPGLQMTDSAGALSRATRARYVTNFPHPLLLLVISRTLMGVHPISVLFGSVASYLCPLYADGAVAHSDDSS